MRQTYPPSEETKMVIDGIEKPLADETEWEMSHIYALKEGKTKDPFSPFRWFFRRVARTSFDKALIYYNALGAILEVEAKRQNILPLPPAQQVGECAKTTGEAVEIALNPNSTDTDRRRAFSRVADSAARCASAYDTGDGEGPVYTRRFNKGVM